LEELHHGNPPTPRTADRSHRATSPGSCCLPYTPLTERFLPLLADAGVDGATIRSLTHDNPFAAFAHPQFP
jgi:predicted metal-dependent phosphotriesterase family hydrolase